MQVKIILLTVCASCLPHLVNAQRFTFGLAAGTSIATLHHKETGSVEANSLFDYKAGAAAEASFCWHFSEKMAIRSGLMYQAKGSKFVANFTDENGNSLGEGRFFNDLHYLSLPLLFQFSFGKKVRPFVQAGAAYHFLVQQTNRAEGELSDVDFVPVKHQTSEYNPVDVSLIAGAGLAIPIGGKLALTVQGRAERGFRDIEHPDTQSLALKNFGYAGLLGLQYAIQ